MMPTRHIRILCALAVPALTLTIAVAIVRAQPPDWAPPVGIPQPPLGVTEVAGPPTLVVDQGQALPNPLPAGAVIEIRGTYSRDHRDSQALVCAGTTARPAFVRGAAGSVVTGSWQISGSNCIFEQLTVLGPSHEITAPADRIVLRDSDYSGTRSGGGLGITTWWNASSGLPANAPVSNVVLLRIKVHDCGDLGDQGDQDVHGLGLYRSTTNEESVGPIFNVWLLDSELARNSGDGMQINAGTGNNAKVHHVYVGRTRAHDNKQVGFGLKQGSDVVFSENRAFSHRPSSSAPGGCFGFLYGPERVWMLYNDISDCTYGVYWGSDLANPGRDSYFIGNTVHDIVDKGHVYERDNSSWGPAGFMFAGGVDRHLARNTVTNVPFGYGVNVPNSQGRLVASNNQGLNVWLENPPQRDLCGSGTLRIGERSSSTSRLRGCSASQNANEAAISATFESLYGLTLPIGEAVRPAPPAR